MSPAAVILAVASPPGRSWRGIVRVSGAGAFDLLRSELTFDETDSRAEATAERGVYRARLRLSSDDHDHTARLPLLVFLFPGPRAYTGEDSAELQVAGNPVLLERVIDVLLSAAARRGIDARRAEAGEYTARAFLNGRLSLMQAEGVAALIAATSDAELRAAHMLTDNTLGRTARRLADELASALALVEAGIDFTDEEDVVAITPPRLRDRLLAVAEQLERVLDRSVGTEDLAAIPWVVLTGRVNAGKSTLFNALLQRQRAVVSDLPGTTRDVLTEPLILATDHGDAEVMLVDLAGADHDPTAMNRRMQDAARAAMDRAEFIVHCVPADATAEDVVAAGSLAVRTKCDLASPPGGVDDISVCAHTGAGLDELRERIAGRLADRAVSLAADMMALRPRHERALSQALVHTRAALGLVEPQVTTKTLDAPELIAASMRLALNELGGLAGDISPDDVLGRVFATFCVGK